MTTQPDTPQPDRKDYRLALAIGVYGLAMYVRTLAPDVLYGDSAEFQTLAYTLGVTHSTGYSIYLLLARLLGFLPIGSPAWRVNLFSAVSAAVTLGNVFLLGRYLTRSRIGALLGAFALGLSYTFWSQAIIAEVYTPALAVLSAILLLLWRWHEAPAARNRALLLAAALTALGLGLHAFVVLIAPTAVVFVILTLVLERVRWPQWRQALLAGVAGVAIGVGIFLIASLAIDLHNPPSSFIRVMLYPSRSIWGLTPADLDSPFERLWLTLAGRQWQDAMFPKDLDIADEFVAYADRLISNEFSTLLLLCAMLGVLVALHTRPKLGVCWLVAFVTILYFVLHYQPPDKYIFYLPTSLLIAVAIGSGAGSVLEWVHRHVLGRRKRRYLAVLYLLAAALLLWMTLQPSWAARWQALRDGVAGFVEDEYVYPVDDPQEPRLVATRKVTSLPENALAISEWRALYTMLYLAHVERLRPDITILEASPHGAEWNMVADSMIQELESALREGRPVFTNQVYKNLREHFRVHPAAGGGWYRLSLRETGPAPAQPAPIFAVPAESIPLSGEWRFAVDPDDTGERAGWFRADFDDSRWTVVTVPHTWGVMPDYADYDGIAWYRRTFTLPYTAQYAHLRLHFNAVFYLARVWLNGQYLGEHAGGYTPFEFDISGLKPGIRNVLAVQVDNRRAPDRIPAVLGEGWSFDWWNYGGIVRDVSLEMTSRAFIVRQLIVARPHLVGVAQADTATITTTVTLRNASGETLTGTLTADVLNEATGLSVLASRPVKSLRVSPGASTDVVLTATVMQPKLWHFDHPHLYRWSTALRDAGGALLHSDAVTFGIRLIVLKDARFYLNGEPVRLVGLTRHADSPWYGLAETTTIMAQDYDDLKTLNMVFSRPVHYPQHEFILDYCDRNGILLIPEVPAWQLTARQMADAQMRALEQQQLREMILAGFNHPSIWAWSVANEIDSQSEEGRAFVRDMVAFVKRLDPTRPVGFASNRLGDRPKSDATAAADFVMMNQYFGTWAGPKTNLGQVLDAIHAAWPDKVVIISEFGFEPRWNRWWGPPTSELDPEQYYFIPDGTPPDSEKADAQRRKVIAEQMEVFRSKPFIAAAIFWTYQDYRTPTGFMMGVVDAQRNRRGSWHLLREEYAPGRIESVAFTPASADTRSGNNTLSTRGPVEADVPAYTLRGYLLRWAVTSPDGETVFSEGEVPLPVLEPGSEWSGRVDWTVPQAEHVFTVRIVRPTGFTVIERTYR
jgi:beta-glucuronidase